MLIEAILPALERAQVRSLMQGPSEVIIEDIRAAAAHARGNPDRVFYRVVKDRGEKLSRWAGICGEAEYRPGALAAAVISATRDP